MDNQTFLKQLIDNLKKEIPSQWRVQSYSKTKPLATVMTYIDARQCMELLDEYAVYGWGRTHEVINGNVYCSVTVNMPDGSIQTRSDCGTESSTEKEKGQSSDSFKRACVNFGIGRFLYDLPVLYVDTDVVKAQGNYPKFLDKNKQPIKDLNQYCNDLIQGKKPVDNRLELKPNTPQWNDAIAYLKGDGTLDKIKVKYKLSGTNETILKEAIL